MKIKCAVIEDLLPLYIDGVCSEESKNIVEEHLKECELCSHKFRIQKSEIVLDDDVIKKNLKSKKPFKRIKKLLMIRLIVILIGIPLLFLSIMEVRGEGTGFSALYGRYKAERFLSHIEKGQFASAAKYMAFSGGQYEKIRNEDEAKRQWVIGMQELKNAGIEIISHSQNRIITDDGFTSGYVMVSVRYMNETHSFRLFISTDTGRVEPGSLSYNITYQSQEPTELEIMLMEKISKVISTYNPG